MGGESLTESAETIEFLIDKTHDILCQCRWKMNVFHELFGSLNEHDSDDFSDFYGFCRGMETICGEMINNFLDAEEYVGNIKDNEWMFTEEAKDTYGTGLQFIIREANKAAETKNPRYLISVLRTAADEIAEEKEKKEEVSNG